MFQQLTRQLLRILLLLQRCHYLHKSAL